MRFLSQSGVSIVQGLIVSSVLAGSALVTTRMLQDQKKLQKSVETRDQVEQLHRLVIATLQNREHCSSTISAAGVSAPTLDSERNVDIIYSKTAAGVVTPTFEKTDGLVFEPTKIYMNGNVSIRSMRVMLPKSADPDPAARTITYPSKFRIEYRRMQTKNSGANSNLRTKEGFGAKQIVKYVPLILQINKATNLIDGCYAVQLGETINGTLLDGNNNVNQDFCSNLGNGASLYTWDSTTNKCVLKNNVCPDKFIFGGISSTGNAYCYPLSNYLPNLVNTTDASGCTNTGGTVALVTDAAGKVKITCTSSSTCSAGSVNWSQGSNSCSSSIGAGAGPLAVADSTPPLTGSGTATCSSGTWTVTGGTCLTNCDKILAVTTVTNGTCANITNGVSITTGSGYIRFNGRMINDNDNNANDARSWCNIIRYGFGYNFPTVALPNSATITFDGTSGATLNWSPAPNPLTNGFTPNSLSQDEQFHRSLICEWSDW